MKLSRSLLCCSSLKNVTRLVKYPTRSSHRRIRIGVSGRRIIDVFSPTVIEPVPDAGDAPPEAPYVRVETTSMLIGNTFSVSINERSPTNPPILSELAAPFEIPIRLFPPLSIGVTSMRLIVESGFSPIILNDATIGSMVEARSVFEISSFSFANCDNT